MNKTIINLFWKFGERITAQVITFVVSIVLARLLTPEDYGAIALVTIFISIANVFVTSGFGTTLIQKKNTDNIDFSSVFYVNIIFSIVIYFCLYFAAPYISEFYELEIITPVIRVLAIRIPIAAINSVQHAYISKTMQFKKFFISTLFGTLISGFIGCYMAYSGFGIWALVGQYLSNTAIDTIVLWFTVKWRPEFVFSFSRVRVLLNYGWKLLIAGLLDTGYQQVRSLVIGKKYSSSDLAYYNRGQQYPQLIVTNINTSISSVLLPTLASNQDDLVAIKRMTRKAILMSSYLMWPLMIGLAVCAEPIVLVMLTEKWLDCVPYIQIACITYAFTPIHTANLEALKAIGRSDEYLKLEIIKKITGIFLLLITMNHGVMAIALSMIIATIISCFINAYPNTILLKYKYFEQFKDIIVPIIISVIMAIIIYPIKYIITNPIYLIAAQTIAGVIIYVIFSLIMKVESYYYILESIRGKKK